MSSWPNSLSNVSAFRGVDPATLELLESRLSPIPVRRGDCIVRQGESADALYVVTSGRFAVEVEGVSDPVTEISHGSTIGEIAFFAGGPRTATVRAIRDAVVVRLSRADFDDISARSPAIWSTVTATLAERLAAETRRASAMANGNGAGLAPKRAPPRPRTITVLGAEQGAIPPVFLTAFIEQARNFPDTLIVSRATVFDAFSDEEAGDLGLTEALNALEGRYQTVVFIADTTLTPWSEKAIRQADEILIIAAPPDGPVGSTVPLSTLEGFALSLHRPAARRLAIVHAKRGVVQGTRHWLTLREPTMHHHVALGEADDVARLWRFLRGEALGLVACGGGAYCAAHIGVYRAFREHGPGFDIIGGTSGGAAMGATFAQDLNPELIDEAVHRMFIDGKAMGRFTLPRYGLLDHTHFDSHLEREYGNLRIEDLWKPFFAVSTDLSDYDVEVHRTGLLWHAVRASAAIPGLLPPLYTEDGRMLVDGSVIANVPIETMHALKRGPNVVVSFHPPQGQRYTVDYAALPKRKDLIWGMLNPLGDGLPDAPSAASVLVRSMMANRSRFERQLNSDDWLLVPPSPPGMGPLDWRLHRELSEAAYRFTLAELQGR